MKEDTNYNIDFNDNQTNLLSFVRQSYNILLFGLFFFLSVFKKCFGRFASMSLHEVIAFTFVKSCFLYLVLTGHQSKTTEQPEMPCTKTT